MVISTASKQVQGRGPNTRHRYTDTTHSPRRDQFVGGLRAILRKIRTDHIRAFGFATRCVSTPLPMPLPAPDHHNRVASQVSFPRAWHST
ncbi:MAG: hypothetical protein IPO22_23830 [Anaerolineales bacterium]|nr:hypothetical protein [Anaerolineales bacterium]